MNLADAMARAKVLDIDLQKQLRPYMESMIPLPGIFNPDFVAANQGSRANNVISGTKKEQLQQIIKDIRYVIYFFSVCRSKIKILKFSIMLLLCIKCFLFPLKRMKRILMTAKSE